MAKGRRRRPWHAALLLGAALSAALLATIALAARAEDAGTLYQATTIVTGTDMRSRPSGFAQCLRAVLVKVSGEPRLRDDPRTDALAAHADALVTSFDYVDRMAGIPTHDSQGTGDRPYFLTVDFDPARIDQALAELGTEPWRGERPLVVPVLRVRGRQKPAYLLSAEAPAGTDQRASFGNAARQYGITLRIPSEAELAAWHVEANRFPTPETALPSGQVIVAGTLEWSEAATGWVGSWRMRWKGVDHAWRISGVSYDDAFRDIIRGVVLLASGRGAPD